MKRTKPVLVVAILVCVSSLPACRRGVVSEPQSDLPAANLQPFPVSKDGGPLVLPVSYEGKNHLFLLDTGSSLTVFDRTLLQGAPKQTTIIETSTGDRTVELYDSPAARIGKWNLQSGPHVIGSDLSMVRRVTGIDVMGVVGMDFLAQHVVQVNIEAGTVMFLDTAKGALGEAVPLLEKKKGPRIDIAVSGSDRTEKFLVDTGSSNVAHMRPDLLGQVAEARKARIVGQSFTVGLEGVRANEKWLVDELNLGSFGEKKILATQASDNVLGLGFWSQYLVTFDFPNNIMYLKKVRTDGPPLNLDMSGLHLLRIDGSTVVHSVDEGSPAARSGIAANDVITQLDEQQVSEITMHSLRRRFCTQDEEVRVQVLRGTDKFDIKFTLGKLGER